MGADEAFGVDRDEDSDTVHALTEMRASLTWLLGPLLALSVWNLWRGTRRGWVREPGLARRLVRPWALACAAVGAAVAAGAADSGSVRARVAADIAPHPRALHLTWDGTTLSPDDPGFSEVWAASTWGGGSPDGGPSHGGSIAAGLWWDDAPTVGSGFPGGAFAVPVWFLSVSLWYVAGLCLLANAVTLARRRRVSSRPA